MDTARRKSKQDILERTEIIFMRWEWMVRIKKIKKIRTGYIKAGEANISENNREAGLR